MSTSSVLLRFLTQELIPLCCVLENSIELLKWIHWYSWVTGAKCFSISTWFCKCSLPRLNQSITKVPTVIFKIHVHSCVCRAFFCLRYFNIINSIMMYAWFLGALTEHTDRKSSSHFDLMSIVLYLHPSSHTQKQLNVFQFTYNFQKSLSSYTEVSLKFSWLNQDFTKH